MSYVPPHKRHLKTDGGNASSPPSPSPPPISVMPRSQRNQNSSSEAHPRMDITYAKGSISKWFAVGLADHSKLATHTRLDPLLVDGKHSLELVLAENGDGAPEFSENPWVLVAETVKEDFVSSLLQLKDVIKDFGTGTIQPHLLNGVPPGFGIRRIKPYLVFRFGKVLFYPNHRNPLHSLESLKGSSQPESTLKQLRRSLWTNIPPSCMQHFPEMGLEFKEENDSYLLKLLDESQPNSLLSCKCAIEKETNRLRLSKIEVSRMRHLVEDVSCIDKNIDLRVQLLCKRRLYVVDDKDLQKIETLISYAMLDSEVKGGLRWPLGKRSLDQFSVVQFFSTNSRRFSNSSMKLVLRQVDRYDLKTSTGEVASEVYVKLPRKLASQLGEETSDPDVAFEMLKEQLEFTWKHFLY